MDFQGKRFTARAQLPRPTGVTVMASALRPNGFRVCGELAEGAISWVCPLPCLRGCCHPRNPRGAERQDAHRHRLSPTFPSSSAKTLLRCGRAPVAKIGFYPPRPVLLPDVPGCGVPRGEGGRTVGSHDRGSRGLPAAPIRSEHASASFQATGSPNSSRCPFFRRGTLKRALMPYWETWRGVVRRYPPASQRKLPPADIRLVRVHDAAVGEARSRSG